MKTLGWFPPAPAEGPASMLDLPPDDYSMECKLNGCRVIIAGGFVYTRHGSLLTKGKGKDRIPRFWKGKPLPTCEGEWVDRTGTLWLFDLPDHPGTYDERVKDLAKLVESIHDPKVKLVPRATGDFRRFYEDWKEGGVEGVVMKRRSSHYQKCVRPGTVIREWIKRRYCMDETCPNVSLKLYNPERSAT